jgi:hypothetical protein
VPKDEIVTCELISPSPNPSLWGGEPTPSPSGGEGWGEGGMTPKNQQ